MPIAHSTRERFARYPALVSAIAVLLSLLVSVQAARAHDGDLDPSFGNGGRVMTDLVGVERNATDLRIALRSIAELETTAQGVTRSFLNMTTSATLVAAGALQREESRGGHFRTDFPETRPEWAHHTEMTLDQALAIRAGA